MRKTSDYVLAGLFTVGGILLMVENLMVDGSSLAHPLSTTSWLILPVFLLVTVPILWRRRNVLVVAGLTVAAMAVHVLAFGWLTRCGVGLPLAAALAYATARFAGGVRRQAVGLVAVVTLIVLTLVRDSSIGGLPSGLELALPVAALFYGIGLAVQNRMAKKQLVPA